MDINKRALDLANHLLDVEAKSKTRGNKRSPSDIDKFIKSTQWLSKRILSKSCKLSFFLVLLPKISTTCKSSVQVFRLLIILPLPSSTNEPPSNTSSSCPPI